MEYNLMVQYCFPYVYNWGYVSAPPNLWDWCMLPDPLPGLSGVPLLQDAIALRQPQRSLMMERL